ncbi:MAG TPA: right-handed parallel beta-helix repeat-containing protein [Candidatus Krumholzibacteria bacterium]|nr:right-handed parallel beta-helix repeat-containing protein [Candidatus Krumholzibacteria bacterium]
MSRLWLAGVVFLTLPATTGGRTLQVPADYPTVRRAVYEAADGDTVQLAAGTFVDRFTIGGNPLNNPNRNIVLRGVSRDATILDGSSATGNVVTLIGCQRSMIIEDMTITGGTFNRVSVESTGAAVYVNGGHPTIQRCNLVENHGNAAGGVDIYFFSQPLIRDCIIAYNTGGGILIETDTGAPGPAAEVRNNTIVRNQGGGISVIKGARALVENCTIAYNSADGVSSEITQGTGTAMCYVTVRRNIITHNGGGGIVRELTLGTCYTLECNDVWGNAGVTGGVMGNYQGYSSGDPCFSGRGAGDVSFDPLYQDVANDNFLLSGGSPLYQLCVPGSCGALGADTDCADPVQSVTWSEVKALFR